jgi:hypothetical protein
MIENVFVSWSLVSSSLLHNTLHYVSSNKYGIKVQHGKLDRIFQ